MSTTPADALPPQPREAQQRVQWYSWGSGASGLLAHGDTADSEVPTPITAPPFAPAAAPARIASLACSGVYSLLCTADGQLWHCGDVNQSCSAPGGRASSQPLLLPARIALAKRIVSVACGWSHCGCISDEGQLFMWGNNKQQQLGLPVEHSANAVAFCPTATLVALPSPALSIACGWRHTLVLTRSHQLLGWGDNKAGQLSVTASSLSQPTPLFIADLPGSSHISSVHCGWRFSLLVSSCGRVYCCGDNKHGQCGVGVGLRKVECWTEVAADVRAVQAAVGWTHCLLLDAQGRLWTFGRRSLGQAGTGRQAATTGSSATPEQVALPGQVRVTGVACGSESCLCVDSDGGVWSWGWNEHGNVGSATALLTGDDAKRHDIASERIVWEPRRWEVGGMGEAWVLSVVAGGASVFAAVSPTRLGSDTMPDM